MASRLPKIGNKVDMNKFTKERFIEAVHEAREIEGTRIDDFGFNKKRVRILNNCPEVKENSNGLLYWMHRDCRVQDNWAMLFAQKLARKNKLPLFVCYFTQISHELVPTRRHFQFLINGLKEVAEECSALNIGFHLINDQPEDGLIRIVKSHNLGAIICELDPLREAIKWQEDIKERLPPNIPFIQVDAHNIVPVWIASEKQEIAARTIRPKIQKKLEDYLTGFPVVSKHEYSSRLNLDGREESFEDAEKHFKSKRDLELPQINWAKPGTNSGFEMLHTFLVHNLKSYAATSGDPAHDCLSRMSPWVNFGQISAQRIALEVENFKNEYKKSVEKYLEELIIRRELAENFCFYNENYDNIYGADKWARTTLEIHRNDKREHIYTKEEFANAKTHDEIWNAAQIQVINEGRMHGYIRMYWCKKILEWTKTPEEALAVALYLNDTYALDGNNPNGYVGVMWSICGVHDHSWTERPVFGKIRYMVFTSMIKKFDASIYCARYGRKIANTPMRNSKKQTVSNRTNKKRKASKDIATDGMCSTKHAYGVSDDEEQNSKGKKTVMSEMKQVKITAIKKKKKS